MSERADRDVKCSMIVYRQCKMIVYSFVSGTTPPPRFPLHRGGLKVRCRKTKIKFFTGGRGTPHPCGFWFLLGWRATNGRLYGRRKRLPCKASSRRGQAPVALLNLDSLQTGEHTVAAKCPAPFRARGERDVLSGCCSVCADNGIGGGIIVP